jgi:uncharacterized protein YjbI with pentapeptide repeats
MSHRFIVTGRPLALHGVERTLPQNLARVKILPMGDAEQACWFDKWSALGQPDPQDLKELLNDVSLPDRVQELAREPLLLYLLAAMHRDGELSLAMFAGAEGARAKVLIYQKTLDWVLTKQRPDWLNRDLTELETDALYRILAEAGLCVVQSGDECASIRMIEERLKTDSEAKDLLETAQAKLHDNPLRNALAAFYLQQGRQGEGSVEFAHKSFSEFLCAERIKQAVEDWTHWGRRNRYEIPDEQMYWELYDLLGTPILTEEIVEYLFELLQASNAFKPIELFDRLYFFYLRWCNHEFIDAPATEEHLPQKKMRKLQALNVNTGLRQVDIYTGLNVLIFLFKLHASAQHPDYPWVSEDAPPAIINFHPCSHLDSETFDFEQTLKIIYYADSLGVGAFTKTVGPHLASANLGKIGLNSANLAGANLVRANLAGANLSKAELDSASFVRANLVRTNFVRANLVRANLSSANLAGANLSRAELDSANFVRANLVRANLTGANFASADLASADLASADLTSTNLYSANLGKANLGKANFYLAYLDRANLDSANLASTNLSGTNLSSANLSSANLSNANLTNADLDSADLNSANLDSANLGSTYLNSTNFNAIKWNSDTDWKNVEGLKTAMNVPMELKQQLGLEE